MKWLLNHPLRLSLVLLPATLLLLGSDAAELPKLPRVDELKHKNYSEPIAGTEVKFDMIAIPGGAYLMGSPASEKGRREDEGPQHPVAVRPFWMGKCEVTWDEFDAYWKEEDKKDGEEKKPEPKKDKKDPDAITRPTPPYADETFGHGREGQPVLCITHHTAMEYCRWLSKKTGKIYRLPTEAEWEWAARAGSTTAYSFGDDPAKLGDYAWFKGNSEGTTHEVGKKKPNAWGLHDMYGNVGEWCVDHYRKDYYAAFVPDKIAEWPVVVPTADRFSHVVRGGAWSDKPEDCRSATRRGSDKTWIRLDPQRPQSIWWLTSAEFVGFRVVRPVEEQENLKGLRSKVTRDSK
jgi:formylglycine-generating enzyme required for sulfatase activity